MAYIMHFALIAVFATIAAVLLLGAIELFYVAWWKQRRCQRCGKRLGVVGWDWSHLQQHVFIHTNTVNNQQTDSVWVVTTCPHCEYDIIVREAPRL